MKFDMVMPKMGESITEGTVLKWLKNTGDPVEKDEMILEISTDKVDSEIPAPVDGVIGKILVQEGDTVEVGTPIAVIETEATEQVEATDQETEEQTVEPEGGGEDEQIVPSEKKVNTANQTPSGKTKAANTARFFSPVVMNIAAEHGIPMPELEKISGSGINGRVTKKDILSYIENGGSKQEAEKSVAAPSFTPGEREEIVPMDHVRKSIARHMVHSKQTSAHVSLYSEVDMKNVVQVRESNKKNFEAREGIKLTYMPFIAEATIKALQEFPIVNASIDGDTIIMRKYVNLGIAVAVDYGLIVPNIFEADSQNLTGLARSINDLAERARSKKLKPQEVQGGTFSISNFGVYGTTIGFPIINQPQVAILGVGAMKKKPVVIDDAIAIRPMMYVSLTIDHRLIDGATGSQFLQRICQLLERYDPESLL